MNHSSDRNTSGHVKGPSVDSDTCPFFDGLPLYDVDKVDSLDVKGPSVDSDTCPLFAGLPLWSSETFPPADKGM